MTGQVRLDLLYLHIRWHAKSVSKVHAPFVGEGSAGMMIPESFKLSLLQYGHPGPIIRRLKGQFDRQKMTNAIQLGEMACGCWVVLDGNNRIAMILRRDPDATIGALPEDRVLMLRDGEWDDDTLEWWNPNPQSFDFVQRHSAELYRARRNKSGFASGEEYEVEIAHLTDRLTNTPHRCVANR